MLTEDFLSALRKKHNSLRLFGVAESSMAYFAAQLKSYKKKTTVLVARNHGHLEQLIKELSFFLPKMNIAAFPSWDVQPYDRLAPDSVIQAQRMKALSLLAANTPCVLVTTVNALSIKVPPVDELPEVLTISKSRIQDRDEAIRILEKGGYLRVGTVMEPGEYAVRGSLLDVFVATEDEPTRIDFFDDEVESIKSFDPASQRTDTDLQAVVIKPVSEVVLSDDRISLFRTGYRDHFPNGADDALYRDISEGRKNELQDHYLPLFYEESLVPLFSLLPEDTLFIHHGLVEDAFKARTDEIQEGFNVRKSIEAEKSEEEPYRPLPSELLYMTSKEWQHAHENGKWLLLENFDDGDEGLIHLPCEAVSIATGEKHENLNLDETVKRISAVQRSKGRVFLSAFAPSSLARMERTLHDHGLEAVKSVNNYSEIKEGHICVGVTSLNWGFHDKGANLLIITEQDLFGEKRNKPVRRKKAAEDVISHFSEMAAGDYVVHHDHGIGQFIGLVTMEIGGTKNDFLELHYDGGDKLFVPVVNLDVLSKYSGDDVRLDKLGGASWQNRKAKVKRQLLDMAGDLIDVAAKRKMRKGHVYGQPDGMYDEFCAEFPYVPTPEQQSAVDDVEADLYGETAMDRLVVGDVGFGKTEVALRAAFVAAADGKQVAVIAPTTLLARQHMDVFTKRFAKFPFKVGLLSRLVTGKQKTETLKGLKDGSVDIIIGTHALLSDSVEYNDLGLLVIDEEQRFGVTHKEKLKKLKADVDVLTLTATPIPRTFQMAMSGLKGMSLITTPPVDRLAIRSYVMKWDRKTIREGILREIFRGGQVFVVTPRVEGLQALKETLENLVPEAKIRTAHGQMPKDALDRTMTDFYEGHFNVLVATTIIESGIDVPKANTLIVHKADRFGLAQLYQIRGRVGRSKVRAYAYFLLPKGNMTENAVKRLRILQRLEGVGAGFTLASYDLDIRGSGNVLGKEQSGHIQEVGFELYNKMLSEAVAAHKAGLSGVDAEEDITFTPTLNLGLSFLIPEEYVPDLATRMSLYRRLSKLIDMEDVEDFRAELIDRFGHLPSEVAALLEVVMIKNRCKNLGIERVEVGAKGTVLTFFKNRFNKPQELFDFIMKNAGIYKMRPDQKIVAQRPMGEGLGRLKGVQSILGELESL